MVIATSRLLAEELRRKDLVKVKEEAQHELLARRRLMLARHRLMPPDFLW